MRGVCLDAGVRWRASRLRLLAGWPSGTRHEGRPAMADVRTVIAVIGEDDRYARIRRAATKRAHDEHATLILYDIDAASSSLESPVPTEWSGEGTDEGVGDRLGPQELEVAGREAIARQVTEARRAGIDAWGWLPSGSGTEALIEHAARQPGSVLLVPDDDPDLDLDELPEAELIPTAAR